MSNDAVGTTYNEVIQEVVSASRQDFEDSGVSLSILNDLQNLWEQNLAAHKTAIFPWQNTPRMVKEEDASPPLSFDVNQLAAARAARQVQMQFSNGAFYPAVSQSVAGLMNIAGAKKQMPQNDGADSDAINSDLDSETSSVENDDLDDEAQGIMLCLYDKVQRTKNKWKCVMKDGMITVNGKEYVFSKATGEFEW